MHTVILKYVACLCSEEFAFSKESLREVSENIHWKSSCQIGSPKVKQTRWSAWNMKSLQEYFSRLRNKSQRASCDVSFKTVDDEDPREAVSKRFSEPSLNLSDQEQTRLESVLRDLGESARDLFVELVKRLDENPRKLLILIATRSMSSNRELADAMGCAPASIERYHRAIRRKLEEIVNE